MRKHPPRSLPVPQQCAGPEYGILEGDPPELGLPPYPDTVLYRTWYFTQQLHTCRPFVSLVRCAVRLHVFAISFPTHRLLSIKERLERLRAESSSLGPKLAVPIPNCVHAPRHNNGAYRYVRNRPPRWNGSLHCN